MYESTMVSNVTLKSGTMEPVNFADGPRDLCTANS